MDANTGRTSPGNCFPREDIGEIKETGPAKSGDVWCSGGVRPATGRDRAGQLRVNSASEPLRCGNPGHGGAIDDPS